MKECDSTDCIYYNEDFEDKCELEERGEDYDFENCGDYIPCFLKNFTNSNLEDKKTDEYKL